MNISVQWLSNLLLTHPLHCMHLIFVINNNILVYKNVLPPTVQLQAFCFYGYFLLQNGTSPLWIALDEGHLDLVKTLIQAGADANQTNKVCNV